MAFFISLLTIDIFFAFTDMNSKIRIVERENRGLKMEKEDLERVRI